MFLVMVILGNTSMIKLGNVIFKVFQTHTHHVADFLGLDLVTVPSSLTVIGEYFYNARNFLFRLLRNF